MQNRPLSHIRVVDFGHYLAGPLVGMMLADLGAEVIRIDPPGGPRWQDPAFDMLSRGKRALTLDLKTDEGRDTALDLVCRADVVIDNFRPGVMKRLGLGPDALRQANADIVSLSLPGFASTDPDLAGIAAWEAVIAARTGQFTDMGLNRQLMGINPSFTPLGLASAYGAAFGAMAVLFALTARSQMGGDHIEVPLASALLEGLVYNCEQIENYPDRYKSPRELELERREHKGLPNNLSFAELSEFLDPFYRTYTCADGRGFYIVSCSIVNHPQRVLEVLGLGDLLKDLPDFDVYVDQADWPGDWALRSYPVGSGDRKRLSDAMKAAFLTRPSHEWETLFGAAKAPATAQRSTAEWLADPHALASGLVIELDDPRHGRMHQMGNVAWLADDQRAMEKNAGPESDDFRDELDGVLAEPPRRPKSGDGKGMWLDGLKVLDLTNVIAGPTIGSTLSRFGAQVTLVQPVRPSVDPWNAVVFGLHAQRGKESVLLDLRSEQGQGALRRMLAEVDVVTMNGTDQQRQALGLTEAQLKEINPRLILVQLDAWGGPRRGAKSDHLGYDDLAQAATGVMTRFGGGPKTPEEHAHFGTIDALTGHCACVALGAALERLRVTGKGGIARASLAAAGEMIQAQFMYDFEGRSAFDEPSGRSVQGWGPFYRCYMAEEGWMFFAAPTEREAALKRVPDLADLIGKDDTELEDALVERFAHRPVADWVRAFAGGSVGITPLGSLHGTRDEGLQRESEGKIDISQATFRTVRHDQHPMGRWVDLVAPNAVRPEKAKITIPGPAPKYGQDTRAILTRLGYADDEIGRMIESGAAAESWSDKYLPE
ncbi:cag pathogenicity island protein Cag17 [Ruegeria marisrubri]|uniref:Cag pathogenicity island protein Cag17 n=1 Tax=Ruegeria marisrubri TaxID=1685379 RepID=A0A0X3TPB3_9RHOB|nr:CoA transferase [Ruegeria marisrubri]KUJ76881.1 cag pathogenicity island protein Cag17 [Ruegeria marisrubri]